MILGYFIQDLEEANKFSLNVCLRALSQQHYIPAFHFKQNIAQVHIRSRSCTDLCALCTTSIGFYYNKFAPSHLLKHWGDFLATLLKKRGEGRSTTGVACSFSSSFHFLNNTCLLSQSSFDSCFVPILEQAAHFL